MKTLLLLVLIGNLSSITVQPHINRIKVINRGEYCSCLYYYGVDSLTMGVFYSDCDTYKVGDPPPVNQIKQHQSVAEIK